MRFDIHCGVLKAKIRFLRNAMCVRAHPAHRSALTALLLGLTLGTSEAQHFRLSEDIVSDPVTGAAILGYDPIAYFIDGRPRAGSARHQANAAGKVWYFASLANRAEFEARHEAYLPGFGGHDPVAVARGVAVVGSPDIHAVIEGKLYLFRNTENRERLLAAPELLGEAARVWPEVRFNLTP